MIKKIPSFFSSDFKSLFVWHLTGKILRFEFYPKIVFFECKFRILRSAITLVQDWPIVTYWFSYIVLKYKEKVEVIFGHSSTLTKLLDCVVLLLKQK